MNLPKQSLPTIPEIMAHYLKPLEAPKLEWGNGVTSGLYYRMKLNNHRKISEHHNAIARNNHEAVSHMLASITEVLTFGDRYELEKKRISYESTKMDIDLYTHQKTAEGVAMDTKLKEFTARNENLAWQKNKRQFKETYGADPEDWV